MSFQRGGRDGNSFTKNLPFGLNYSDVGINDNTELPSIPLPVNGIITGKERSTAIRYMNFVKTIKEGPFYTGSLSLSVNGSGKGLSLIHI